MKTKSASLLALKERKRVTGACLENEVSIPDGTAHCAVAAPDGQRLLIGCKGVILVLDLDDGSVRSVDVDAARFDAVSRIQFTHDKKRVVATLWCGSVVVLGWPELQPIAVHDVAQNRLHALAVMRDDKSAWVGGHDRRRSRIDLATGKVMASHGDESMWMQSASLSPDGKLLVTSDAGTMVRFCDAKTGAATRQEKFGTARDIVFRGDDVLFASIETRVIDRKGKVTSHLVGEHRIGAAAAAFLDDEFVVTVGEHDPLLCVWNRRDSRALYALQPMNKPSSSFAAIVAWDNDRIVSVPRSDAPVQVWRKAALADAARARLN